MKIHKHTGPKWSAAQREARKAARAAAAAGHRQGNNVPALRERIDRLEQILGIVPTNQGVK